LDLLRLFSGGMKPNLMACFLDTLKIVFPVLWVLYICKNADNGKRKPAEAG